MQIRGFRSAKADHPRSRGVYVSPDLMIASAWGSSPLARGLHDGAGLCGDVGRIIPARAGFTHRADSIPIGRGDHPRSRGVYGKCMARFTWEGGSSPLARGLLA